MPAAVRGTGDTTERRLSSLLTFTEKFVFPTVWLGGFGSGTVVIVINPPRDGTSPLIFVAALVFGILMFARWSFPLKKVVATRKGLVVSNYRREALVGYEQISKVREHKLLSIRPITVELRSPTPFGSTFVFMPYHAFVIWSDHPVATFLRERAAAAGREADGIA